MKFPRVHQPFSSDGVLVQTVEIECGTCKQRMAIALEHLGADVECPHCRGVVKTGPSPAASPPAHVEGPPPVVELVEHTESIFAEPPPSDALFDEEEPALKVLMPEEDAPMLKKAPSPPRHRQAERRPATRENFDEEPVDLAAMSKSTTPAKRGTLGHLMVTLLVPYAIFCIVAIAYLRLTFPELHRFDYLPDPRSVRGGPTHDESVPDKNIVSIGNSVRVGSIEITPLSIKQTAIGALRLEFRAKNVSSDQSFIPIESEFFRSKTHYTFLQLRNGSASRVYGGELDFGGKANPELKPGDEIVVIDRKSVV